MINGYDVFLSHNSADKDAVELIAHRLREEAGLNPFLDKWHLVPGEGWQVALEVALEASETVAVFIGPSGISPWHNEELRTALNRAVRTRDEYRVIPVLLPNANPEDVSAFLAQRTWVDFRSGLDGTDPFDRLVAGIKGQAIHSGTYELPDEPAPYRGLLRFEAEQAEFFYGREADTDQLLNKVSQSPFVAVIGASGSGKSSLVRAGLIPSLKNDQIPGSGKWRHIIITPGSYPIRALADQLAILDETRDRLQFADQLEKRLLAGREGLRTTISTLLADSKDEAGSVLLVIDQFEELFTLCLDTSQQRCNEQALAFIHNITDAVISSQHQIRIVITLRADFLNYCLAFSELKDLLQDNQLLLGPLDQSVLRDVIVRPAQQVGAFFEKGLVKTILRDVEDNPGSLPLLQHALYELWRARRGPWLTLEAYEKSGGVRGALHRRAQKTYDSLSIEQQDIARNIFLRLTSLGEGVSDTRRRVDFDELYLSGIDQDQVDVVLHKLSGSNARLIVTTETEVEVAHEALIQGWGTLREWLDTDRESLRIHRNLTQDAEEWDKDLNRDQGALYRGARLAQVLEWAEDHAGDLNPLENEFLMASRVHQVNELEDAKRQAGRLRQRAIYLTVALVVALIAAFFAFQFWNRSAQTAERNAELAVEAQSASTQAIAQQATAEAAKEDAIQQKQLAEAASTQAVAQQATAEAARALAEERRQEAEYQNRQAFANSLAVQALGFFETYPQQSLLLAVEGGRVIAEKDDREPASLRSFLFKAFRDVSGIGLTGHHDAVWSVSFSPDGRWLATSSRDGTLHLWDMANELASNVVGQDPTSKPAHTIELDGEIFSITFSPDSQWLAASGGSHHIWVWDLSDSVSLENPVVLEEHDGIVDFIQFNPRNRDQLVSGSRDKKARIWDLSSLDPATSVQTLSHDGDITAISFSSDGLWLATGDVKSNVRLWKLGEENVLEAFGSLNGHEGAITDLEFSPNNDWLASTSEDKRARLWNLSSPEEGINSIRLPGHEKEIRSVTFSKDGQTLYTAGLDHTILEWDLSLPNPGQHPTVLSGHKESILVTVIDPNGRWLMSGSSDGIVGVWDLLDTNSIRKMTILRGHEGAIRTLDISPDGHWLATGSTDQSVRLWKLGSRSSTTYPITLIGHEKSIQAIDISPDGSWVASGDNEGKVRLWRLNSVDSVEDGIILEEHSENILAATFSPDGQWLATGSNDDTIRLWELNELPSSIVLSGHTSSVEEILFSHNQKWLISRGRDSTARLWNLNSANPNEGSLAHGGGISSIAVKANCPWLVVGSADGAVQILDLELINPIENPTRLSGQLGDVKTVDISPDCNWITAGDSKGVISLWDLRLGNLSTLPILLEGHAAPIVSVAFDSQNRWLVSASDGENFAFLWDLRVENPADNAIMLNGHEKPIEHLDITPDGRWLITGSRDFTLRLWDLNTADPSINSLVFPGVNIPTSLESDNDWLVIGSQDRKVRVWPLNLTRLYEMACILAGRNLTQVEWNQYFSDEPYNRTCPQWPIGE